MNLLQTFSRIQVFVFDIDGVLTDGRLLLQEDGTMLRSMNIKDGYALQLAIKNGYEIVIISGGSSNGAKIRLEKLGISKVFIGVDNKKQLLEDLAAENNWDLKDILYMGDDMPDLEVLTICGLKTCPKDAVSEIKEHADYISSKKGGDGCVRDVLEKTMKIQGKWLS